MAFGKAIGTEAFDLFEAGKYEFFVIAARDHAADEFLPKFSNGADMAESGHGAAQTIGFL